MLLSKNVTGRSVQSWRRVEHCGFELDGKATSEVACKGTSLKETIEEPDFVTYAVLRALTENGTPFIVYMSWALIRCTALVLVKKA